MDTAVELLKAIDTQKDKTVGTAKPRAERNDVKKQPPRLSGGR